MKKLILIPFLLFTLLSMAACGGDNENPFTPEVPEQPGNGDKEEPDTPEPGENGRYLVLYSSRTSNTKRVAQLIQTTLDCDFLKWSLKLRMTMTIMACLNVPKKNWLMSVKAIILLSKLL